MPERIVYIIGAGFSAPLDLPVMRNFVARAKDISESSPAASQHLSPVLSEIETLYKSTHFFNGDLGDIEEVLSVLHTRDVLGSSLTKERFVRFVSTVVEKATPPFPPFSGSRPASNWEVQIFGHHELKRLYSCFAASLLFSRISERDMRPGAANADHFNFEWRSSPTPQYCVVSLNYDEVLDRALSVLNQYSQVPIGFRFRDAANPAEGANSFGGMLLRPHGCVSDGKLLAPTWNKDLEPYHISVWNAVIEALAAATQIRIIGYSLPDSDTYIKYFLKVAALRSSNLKKIDVICRDSKGEARKRYEKFIAFRDRRFRSGDTADYLRLIFDHVIKNRRGHLDLDRVETAHEQFFQGQ